MATVADIMDSDPVSVAPDDDIKTVLDLLREHDLPGIPVVDPDRKVVGIITESDLVISDEDSDFHLPHYVNIMGGIVFLESMKHFEERAKKAVTRVDVLAALTGS
jgi:predicted transcriptional regulator